MLLPSAQVLHVVRTVAHSLSHEAQPAQHVLQGLIPPGKEHRTRSVGLELTDESDYTRVRRFPHDMISNAAGPRSKELNLGLLELKNHRMLWVGRDP